MSANNMTLLTFAAECQPCSICRAHSSSVQQPKDGMCGKTDGCLLDSFKHSAYHASSANNSNNEHLVYSATDCALLYIYNNKKRVLDCRPCTNAVGDFFRWDRSQTLLWDLINMQNVLNHVSDRSSLLTGKCRKENLKFSAFGPWRLLHRPKLRRHSWRICLHLLK